MAHSHYTKQLSQAFGEYLGRLLAMITKALTAMLSGKWGLK